MAFPEGEGVAVACRLEVHGLCHIGLYIDEHLSLGLSLFGFSSGFFLLHGTGGLIHFLLLLYKVIFIFILYVDSSSPTTTPALPDVMQLQLTAHHL